MLVVFQYILYRKNIRRVRQLHDIDYMDRMEKGRKGLLVSRGQLVKKGVYWGHLVKKCFKL